MPALGPDDVWPALRKGNEWDKRQQLAIRRQSAKRISPKRFMGSSDFLSSHFVESTSSIFGGADRLEAHPTRKRTLILRLIDLRVVLFSAEMSDEPRGELVIQTIAMPKDTNPNGDIFGGWLTSQMDLGSGILAAKTAQARVVTVAMEGMSFLEPVRVGDTVRCYARVEKIGRTSMTIPVEVWVTRYMTGEERRVTHGVFTLVAVNEFGKPIPVKRGSA
jgi:acyl-CoA thioesterase YciA